MKKKLLIIPLLVNCFVATELLTSCKKNSIYTDSNVIISEVLEGASNNKAIELYNLSDNDVDLSEYKVSIFVKSGKTYDIELSGTLGAKKTYVIASSKSTEDVTSKANLLSENCNFIGNQPIRLYKENKLMDITGKDETNLVTYNKDCTLVRKTNYLKGRSTYEPYEWLFYSADVTTYLGNVDNSVTEEELLAGPQIAEEYIGIAYGKYTSDNTPITLGTEVELGAVCGNGGLVDVTLSNGVDGDTAVFRFPSDFKKTYPSSSNKVRFQGIDTRESYTGNIQEFGIPAKFFTTNILENATDLKIQSSVNGSISENYGRYLGWVWADGTLVNWKVCQRGYSDQAFEGVDTMYYKGLTYASWLLDAVNYAKFNKKGIWGEKDPYWDYNTAKSTYTGETLSPEEYE